jgi:glycosyltransferase involved in cell wall biosynthesis
MDRTRAALQRRGHAVFNIHEPGPARRFDLLHAFGIEPDLWQLLAHWRLNPAPLVVSPVLVVAPGAPECRYRLAARVPLADFGPRMKVHVLRRAAAAVALTEAEGRLLGRLAGPEGPPIDVIGNGVDPPSGSRRPAGLELPERFVLLVGGVSERKRQRRTIEALADSGYHVVVAGGFDGSDVERASWDSAVERTGTTWLGEVARATVAALLAEAHALVHLSSAEGQSLAVLEALAAGTPVVAGALPANRELAARYPALVRIARSEAEVGAALGSVSRGRPADLQSWDEVAARLEGVYLRALGR